MSAEALENEIAAFETLQFGMELEAMRLLEVPRSGVDAKWKSFPCLSKSKVFADLNFSSTNFFLIPQPGRARRRR
jgi:hypothetical protein